MSKSFYSQYKGELILLLVTVLWSATFVIVKESLNDISSMLFIGLRFLIAAIILLPIIIRKKIEWEKISFIPAILLGIVLFAGFATQTVGLKYTSATKSAFLTGSSVAMIPFVQVIIERRRPKPGSVIGVFLVLVGILFLSAGDSIMNLLNDIITNFNFGDFLTLLCALLFAVYVVYLDKLSPKYDFWLLLIVQIGVSAMLAFLFALIFSAFSFEQLRIEITTQLSFGLIYTSIFATLITTTLMTKYQRLVSPTKAGIMYSFEPVFAAMIAYVFISEKITNLGMLGAGLIFTGLIISETFDSFFMNIRRTT